MTRLWGIRHVRWLYLSIRFWMWWDRMGKYLGAFPSERDMQFLRDVREGRA